MTADEIIDMLIECKQNRIVLSFDKDCSKLNSPTTLIHSKWGGFPDVPSNFIWPCTNDSQIAPRPKNELKDDDTLAVAVVNENANSKTALSKTLPLKDAPLADEPRLDSPLLSKGKGRPLSFLMQINLAELSHLDLDESLPQKGIIAFFYDLDAQPWGYEYEHQASHRIYYFANEEDLEITAPPLDLSDDFVLPEAYISYKADASILSWDDFSVPLNIEDRIASDEADQFTIFNNISNYKGKLSKDGVVSPFDIKKLYYEASSVLSRELSIEPELNQVLGHATPLTGNVTEECELVSRGYSYGSKIESIPPLEIELSAANSLCDWQLLLQIELSSLNEICPHVLEDNLTRIFFYVLKDELKELNFERSIAIVQGA